MPHCSNYHAEIQLHHRSHSCKHSYEFLSSEPFKVTDISPKTASPAQQLKIKISGIKCEKWMQFFVRFQSANAIRKTQRGVCGNATVTCYVPEFPAHTLLRVGVTLSNRIVEWSPTKLLVQCECLTQFRKQIVFRFTKPDVRLREHERKGKCASNFLSAFHVF